MTKKKFWIALLPAFALVACNTEPPVYKFKLQSGIVLGTYGWCCDEAGTTCLEKGSGVVPFNMRTYIESGNLAGYFINENWQAAFPNLVNEPDIVNFIIQNNPKALIIKDELLTILKDPNGGPEAENVYVAIMVKAGVYCDKFLGTSS